MCLAHSFRRVLKIIRYNHPEFNRLIPNITKNYLKSAMSYFKT